MRRGGTERLSGGEGRDVGVANKNRRKRPRERHQVQLWHKLLDP